MILSIDSLLRMRCAVCGVRRCAPLLLLTLLGYWRITQRELEEWPLSQRRREILFKIKERLLRRFA